jgi:riboflavin kinase/FMN adenylyltransferase
MRIARGLTRVTQPTALTIGNFDGVHRGHQMLLRLVGERAEEAGLLPAVLTFEPHPRERLAPASAPPRLTPLRDKARLIASEGIAHLHILPFRRTTAYLTAAAFIEMVLVRTLSVRHLVIGDDFRFGSHRSGSLETLLSAGEVFGFTVEALPAICEGEKRISSSAVRAALLAGQMRHAAQLLGRWFAISGRVRRGAQLGRTLGVPTLNLKLPPRLIAPRGVFVGWVEGIADQPQRAVINIGTRPTLGSDTTPTLEAHLLDWQGEGYGTAVTVYLADRLRNEQRFPSLLALTEQIHADIAQARHWHDAHPHAFQEFVHG